MEGADTQVIVTAVVELEKAGFKPKKVLKLLTKTNGDVAAVKAFFEAKKKLDDVIMDAKTSKKKERDHGKKIVNGRKKDEKINTPGKQKKR